MSVNPTKTLMVTATVAAALASLALSPVGVSAGGSGPTPAVVGPETESPTTPEALVRVTPLCVGPGVYEGVEVPEGSYLMRVRHESGPGPMGFNLQVGATVVAGPLSIAVGATQRVLLPVGTNGVKAVPIGDWTNTYTGTGSTSQKPCDVPPPPDPEITVPIFDDSACGTDTVTIPGLDGVIFEQLVGDNWERVAAGSLDVFTSVTIRATVNGEQIGEPWPFDATAPTGSCTPGGGTPTPPIVVPPVVEVPVVDVPVIDPPAVEPTPEEPETETGSAGPIPAPAPAPTPAAAAAPATLPSTGAATNGMIAAAFAMLLAGLGLRRFTRND